MEIENLPLIIELCHIAKTRNDINVRRHRARWRKNYYNNAVAVVEAHRGSNSQLRYYSNSTLHHHINKADEIKRNMARLIQRYPKPKKWQEMGLHKLRSLALQGEGEYAMAKHETMELSIRERARVRFILKKIAGSLTYDNGSIDSIRVGSNHLNLQQINRYAAQFDADVAVEKMLEK